MRQVGKFCPSPPPCQPEHTAYLPNLVPPVVFILRPPPTAIGILKSEIYGKPVEVPAFPCLCVGDDVSKRLFNGVKPVWVLNRSAKGIELFLFFRLADPREHSDDKSSRLRFRYDLRNRVGQFRVQSGYFWFDFHSYPPRIRRYASIPVPPCRGWTPPSGGSKPMHPKVLSL